MQCARCEHVNSPGTTANPPANKFCGQCGAPLQRGSPPTGSSSGVGRELGYHGLDDFIEIKQIFTDGTGLAMKPPHGQVIKG